MKAFSPRWDVCHFPHESYDNFKVIWLLHDSQSFTSLQFPWKRPFLVPDSGCASLSSSSSCTWIANGVSAIRLATFHVAMRSLYQQKQFTRLVSILEDYSNETCDGAKVNFSWGINSTWRMFDRLVFVSSTRGEENYPGNLTLYFVEKSSRISRFLRLRWFFLLHSREKQLKLIMVMIVCCFLSFSECFHEYSMRKYVSLPRRKLVDANELSNVFTFSFVEKLSLLSFGIFPHTNFST
jgi:hypothetical protein